MTTDSTCHCETCDPIKPDLSNMRFIVCATCGNKRCPHATDHRNACTNSNEPGQPGSSWEDYDYWPIKLEGKTKPELIRIIQELLSMKHAAERDVRRMAEERNSLIHQLLILKGVEDGNGTNQNAGQDPAAGQGK